MIIGITLSQLRNSEFDQFIRDMLELVLRNDPAALSVKAEYDVLLAESNALNELLNPMKGSALTKKLEEADQRRDQSITGINMLVNAYTYHYDDKTVAAAETLKRHLSIYGNAALARENYQSETAGIKSLVKDWDNQEHLKAAITTLNLDAWKEELVTGNDEFAELYIGRTEETSAATTDSVKTMRVSMNQNYYALRDMIAAHHQINKGADPWGAVVRQINVLINKYEALTGEPRSAAPSGTAESPVPDAEAPQVEQ